MTATKSVLMRGKESYLTVVLDTPWRAWNEARRVMAIPYIRARFAVCGVSWNSRLRVFGAPVIQRHRGSSIVVGQGVAMRSWKTSNPLTPARRVVLATRARGACIVIGNNAGMTGTIIVATREVTVGERVMLGSNTVIVDTDFHPLQPDRRRERPQDGDVEPVHIGDDVFIGMGAIVLKGVSIGARSVIGAGSVVTGDIPPDCVAAGNPACVLRTL